MKILIVVEATNTGFSSREAVEQEMREAVEFHLDGLRDAGRAPPKATSYATTIEVAA